MITRTIDIKVELTQHDDGTGEASVAVGPWTTLAELTPVGLAAATTAVAHALVETAAESRGAAALLELMTAQDGLAAFPDPPLTDLLRNAGRG